MTQDTTKTFDAARYLVELKGRDYLEVKWRLVWLRTEHPDAAIETELTRLDEGYAVFKAKVSIPGAGSATGWGQEHRELEKQMRRQADIAIDAFQSLAALGQAAGDLKSTDEANDLTLTAAGLFSEVKEASKECGKAWGEIPSRRRQMYRRSIQMEMELGPAVAEAATRMRDGLLGGPDSGIDAAEISFAGHDPIRIERDT